MANEQSPPMTSVAPALPAVLRQALMLLMLAAAVALGVIAAQWAQTPSYTLLYGNLAEKDAAGVLDALGKAGIPYKIDETSGAILVPAKQVHEARLKLAGQGLPKGTGTGFELLDEKSGFGMSQFLETARYQRALEGELARSISTLSSVQSARVHLAIPRPSVFIREREKPRASVLVNLYAGRSLEDDQVAAIVHLVAASVPELSPDRVAVIDEKGRLLTADESSRDLTQSANQLEYTHKIESSYARRIEELLTPVVGAGGVKAQVVADIDFTVSEQTRESYDPQRTPVRSEQTSEETTVGAAGAAGIPGALSNQPPGPATVPEQVAAPAAASPQAASAKGMAAPAAAPAMPLNSSRQTTRNYEIDRTISHTKAATGVIKRLSVAVVVDDIVSVDKKGKISRKPRSPAELERLTTLVKDAVGFDAKRGDTVNVVNTGFSAAGPVAPLPEPPWWKQPWAWDLAKQIGGGLVALAVLLVVVRPLLRALLARPAGGWFATAPTPPPGLAGSASVPQLGAPANYEAQMNTAKSVATQDPKRAAQVMKNWVASDA
jgi:flagellar M-ring protein FliF